MKLGQWIALPLIVGVATVGAACSNSAESLPDESQPGEVPTEPTEDLGTDPMQEPLKMPGEEDPGAELMPEPNAESGDTPNAPETP